MEELKPQFTYQNDMVRIQDMLNNHPGRTAPVFQWEMFYALTDSSDWYQCEFANKSPKKFSSRFEEMMEAHSPDIVKVEITLPKGTSKKEVKTYIIRITGNKVAFWDNKPTVAKPTPGGYGTPDEITDDNLAGNQPHTKRPLQNDGGLGQLGILQLENYKKDWDLEKKQEKLTELEAKHAKELAELRAEIADLERENAEFAAELEEYEAKEKRNDFLKVGALGAIQILGGIMKFDPSTYLGLAGKLLSGDQPQQITDGSAANDKGGGLVEEPGQTNDVIGIIVEFLKTLSPEELQKLISILQAIENKRDILDAVMNYANSLVKPKTPEA